MAKYLLGQKNELQRNDILIILASTLLGMLPLTASPLLEEFASPNRQRVEGSEDQEIRSNRAVRAETQGDSREKVADNSQRHIPTSGWYKRSDSNF